MQIVARMLVALLFIVTRLVLVLAILWIADDLFTLWAHRAVVVPRLNALGEAVCNAMVSGDLERFVNSRPIPEADTFAHEFQSDRYIARTLDRYRQRGEYAAGCFFTVIEGGAGCDYEATYLVEYWPNIFDLRRFFKPVVGTTAAERLQDAWLEAAFRYLSFGDIYTLAVESEKHGFLLEFDVASLIHEIIGWHSHWLGFHPPHYSTEFGLFDVCRASERLLAARTKAGRTLPQYRPHLR